MQYQKGELSREEAADKILHHALKSRRQLFKHDDYDDDDDGQGAGGGKESEDEEFLIPVTYGHLKIEREI